MSFKTSRAIGVFGCAARIIPIWPPIDVPIQSTLVPRRHASSAVMSAQYVMKLYCDSSLNQSLRPRPTMSGQATRRFFCSAFASSSKSRPLRVKPCTQTASRSSRTSPHSVYATR